MKRGQKMLLQRLKEYAETSMDLPPSMYLETPIRWLVDLDKKGNLKGFTQTEGTAKRNDRGKEYLAPFISRSVGISAKLLADNGEYVFGIAKEIKGGERSKKDKRTRDTVIRHNEFIKTVKECAEKTGESAVSAVLTFLEKMDVSKIDFPEDFSPDMNFTFRVDDILPINLESVQRFWADKAGGSGEEREEAAALTGKCIVCGKEKPLMLNHPIKIKGIPGGQKAGTTLVSANAVAFESYGLERSLIAPTCHNCSELYAKAANSLISGEDTHLTVGPLVYIFWTREKQDFSPVNLLSQPDPEEVKRLLESAWRGREQPGVKEDAFYATAFSSNGGRVAVRDWLETTVKQVRSNLARYFSLQAITGEFGEESQPMGLYLLCYGLYRDRDDARKNMVANVPRTLLQVALKGGRFPDWLLIQAVKRNRTAQGVTRSRAALIKMVLLSKENSEKEDGMSELDLKNTNPAYLCGRLLAELEALQRAAIPGLNATIIDRFYGTASSAPATVFGHLWRGAQAHLGKLRKERPGAYKAIQQRLEDIQANLIEYPKVLTLENQGIFALGYYHQRAADRAAAIAFKEGRELIDQEEKNEKDQE